MNTWPSKEDINAMKRRYPIGIKLELLKMDDIQAPPTGTVGTVMQVDDAGTIHMSWETGSTLGLIEGKDKFSIVNDITYKRLMRCMDCIATREAISTGEMCCDEYGDFCKLVENCPEGLSV